MKFVFYEVLSYKNIYFATGLKNPCKDKLKVYRNIPYFFFEERVLVTGASGYSAAHVVKLLQEKGYQVRGTVRRLQDERKVAHLYSLCSGARHPLELVEADLTVDDSWLP